MIFEISARHAKDKFNRFEDKFKAFCLDTLIYDLRKFFYELSFREAFKYIMIIILMTITPSLFILSVFASVYTGFLYTESSQYFDLWLAISLSGFALCAIFFYGTKNFVFRRSQKIANLPKPTNPAEVYASRILMHLKNERHEILESLKSKKTGSNDKI